jgi:hypothetical protein
VLLCQKDESLKEKLLTNLPGFPDLEKNIIVIPLKLISEHVEKD